MKEHKAKRIMLAAPASHSGKTTITCALLWLLQERGLHPVSFKCGPDYIDPLFHKKVLGTDSRNLDLFFAGEAGVRKLLAEAEDCPAVIEGVMGLYDGNDPASIDGSGYAVAEAASCPILLVVDAGGAGRTVISVIKGVLFDDTKKLIRGVLLNRCSAGFYETIRPVLTEELGRIRPDIRLLGCFPKDPSITVGSRHLGLMLPDEIADLKTRTAAAAAALAANADVDGILSLMEEAEELRMEEPSSEETVDGNGLTLAVAYDEAFCFYYRENLEAFKRCGVELRTFSPLHDDALPDACDGILLGGGYPESHLPALSGNRSMLSSIRNAVQKGIPSLAECGGFMYLHREVTDLQGTPYTLVGAVDGTCRYTGRLVRFGYMRIAQVKEQEDALLQSLSGMKGHEFHYYDSTANGDACIAEKPGKNKTWDCIVAGNNGIWGFPHFYYGSDPGFVAAFIKRMREVKDGKFQQILRK